MEGDYTQNSAHDCDRDVMRTTSSSSLFQGAAMPEYIQAIEKYLLDNPKLSKPALVELLRKRFSNLSKDEAWIIVSRYFNKKA